MSPRAGVARLQGGRALSLVDAAGRDVVIIETVGVGQSETAVAGMTDVFVLLQLPNAGDDLQAMLRKLGTGLFVTELMGQGVNYVTGDYSRGAVGFWVEGGEIAYPVEEVTIAGNLREMYRGIVAVGSDVLSRSGRSTGSILIDRMTVAGT